MKSFNGKLALAVAGLALLTTATYAQTPSDAVHAGNQGQVVHHRMHHAHTVYDRHAYHTGTAHHTAAIYNQAAANDASHASNPAGGYVSEAQPLYDVYDAAVVPGAAPSGVACVGGRGVGYYPNPVSYGDSAATIESGGEFTLERGYPGCFAYFGE
jgi:hypothetical protein